MHGELGGRLGVTGLKNCDLNDSTGMKQYIVGMMCIIILHIDKLIALLYFTNFSSLYYQWTWNKNAQSKDLFIFAIHYNSTDLDNIQ